jgi:hypothetical protein
MSVLIIKLYYDHENLKSSDFGTGITQPYSSCYAIFADNQLVTKIVFDEKLSFFPQGSF